MKEDLVKTTSKAVAFLRNKDPIYSQPKYIDLSKCLTSRFLYKGTSMCFITVTVSAFTNIPSFIYNFYTPGKNLGFRFYFSRHMFLKGTISAKSTDFISVNAEFG